MLTPKQQRFVAEYLIDLNGAGAYKRAGYKVKNDHSAAASANKLLTKADIQTAISAAQKVKADKLEITSDYILRGLKMEAERIGEGSSHGARVRAYELLGKYTGLEPEVAPPGLTINIREILVTKREPDQEHRPALPPVTNGLPLQPGGLSSNGGGHR